jgi:ATP-binding cassette subfamily F protein 3
VAALETDIDAAGEQLAQINDKLADQALYQDSSRKQELTDLLAEQAALKRQMAALEEALLTAMETLEQAEQTLDGDTP